MEGDLEGDLEGIRLEEDVVSRRRILYWGGLVEDEEGREGGLMVCGLVVVRWTLGLFWDCQAERSLGHFTEFAWCPSVWQRVQWGEFVHSFEAWSD